MASQKDELFGRIAVEGGYVAQDELDEALANQRTMRESMGVHAALADVLFHKRLLTKDQARDIKHEVELRTGEVHLVAGYEVVSELGEGNYGVVYRARQVGTDDIVALKIILPTKADEDTIKRFRREAEIVSRLDHDNIVKFVEFGYDRRRKCHFYAMELVEGEDLDKRIERRGRLEEDEAVAITGQISMALQHAYFNRLVHRDVKPSNIMVTSDGTAKLCDLGLARPADTEATRMTQSGMFVGSPFYASPEQAKPEKDIDIRTDIYSLGATLYHMVTGHPPFEGATAVDILRKHLDEKVPWPGSINPRLSRGLCWIIMKMMAKDPHHRYRTPNDLSVDLDLLDVGQEPEIGDAARVTSTVEMPARPVLERPAPPPAARRRAVSRALARPRCHICGMSLDPRAVVRGRHLCPSCGAEAPVVPLIETREEGRTAVVVARGECSYDGFVRGLEPVMDAVVAKAPAEVVLDVSGLSQVEVEELASHIVPWAEKVRARGGVFRALWSREARRKIELIGLPEIVQLETSAPGGTRTQRNDPPAPAAGPLPASQAHRDRRDKRKRGSARAILHERGPILRRRMAEKWRAIPRWVQIAIIAATILAVMLPFVLGALSTM
ncbi:MAG: serine/threonine-protein kinase [Planctomycetota bacterium]|jgi:serine/threonine-protein kinase